MGTLIRSREAAAILDVTPATLYAYVSRGRLRRTTASDGRTSLFERDEVEQLAERSRRAQPGPRPTIDVQISSRVTTLDERSLRYRGRDAVDLASEHRFEDVAELLWSSEDDAAVPRDTQWPRPDRSDLDTADATTTLPTTPIGRLAIAAHVLDARHPNDGAADSARRLLLLAPSLLGSARRTGPYALRLAAAWRSRPDAAFVHAVDTALCLLADHELATSTLAVRIAASVRASPYVALAAGFAAVEGRLHGSAAAEAHRFLVACDVAGPAEAIAVRRADGRPIAGFGHKVYRGVDPRFRPLLDAVVPLDPGGRRIELVERTISEVGRVLPHQPNVDLALGAMSWIAGIDADVPIFAVARIAGWTAHYCEELDERPVRFRGVARSR